MKYSVRALGLIVGLSIVCCGQSADAAVKKKAPPPPQWPAVFDADKMYYDSTDGNLNAEGNVVVTHGPETMKTEKISGNTIQGDVKTDTLTIFDMPDMHMTAKSIDYNYKQRRGTMMTLSGKMGRNWVKGDSALIDGNKVVINNATMTGCPAKVPDYHISADTMTIWQGDKIVVRNAKFWIKDRHIFTVPKYQKKIDKDREQLDFPKFTYSSYNGFGISQDLGYPISGNIGLLSSLTWHQKKGFKPMNTLSQYNKGYTLAVRHGYVENSDNVWVKKEHEGVITPQAFRLGKMLTLTSDLSYGTWTEGGIAGWRRAAHVYVSRDVIALNTKTSLHLGTGYSLIDYGYNNSRNKVWSFNAVINHRFSEALSGWFGYNHSDTTAVSPYAYDRIDFNREGVAGLSYRLTRLDRLGVNIKWNMQDGRVKDLDYTWVRNLHCFEGIVKYKSREKKVDVTIALHKW